MLELFFNAQLGIEVIELLFKVLLLNVGQCSCASFGVHDRFLSLAGRALFAVSFIEGIIDSLLDEGVAFAGLQ